NGGETLVATVKRRLVVLEIEFHTRPHHERGEDRRQEQEDVQPVTLLHWLHHKDFDRTVIVGGRRGRNWGKKFRHQDSELSGLEQVRAAAPVSPSYPRNQAQSMDCNSLPGLKRTALPGGMETSAPVRGLRPIPVLRGRTLNTPKPRSSMRSPVESAFFMLSKTVSTASSALVLVIPVRLTTSLMMSSLITGISRLPRISVPQVIDAKGDRLDCQPGDQSRNMADTSPSNL